MKDALREKRCCLMGPAPEWLKRPEDDVRVDLENSIMASVREGCTTFVSTMGRGVGIWGAEIVVRLGEQFPEMGLHLVAAVPCPGFDGEWEGTWKRRYRILLSRAEYVKVLSSALSPGALRARNEWAVTHSVRVIAVCAGEEETREAVYFAGRNRVRVVRIPG